MKRILITAPIRQKPEILKLYLESLNNLTINYNLFKVDKYFVLHNCEELKGYFDNNTIVKIKNDDTTYKTDKNTHHWKIENFTVLSNIKNEIVKYSLDNEYDYTFWVDSDLILHPMTLLHLYNNLKFINEYIMSEVFWTKWLDTDKNKGSNGWDYDQYGGNQARYIEKGIHEVGGTGALILVNNKVYESGVNYSPISNVSFSIWEDRAFSIRAVVNGFKLYMDTHYPAKHLYR